MTDIAMPDTDMTHKPAASFILMIWHFTKGVALPLIALILAVAIALGLGVMAAEDWDGFAQRIDFGKSLAFYSSLGFGALTARQAQKSLLKRSLYGAQLLGLGLVLIFWLIAL